MRVEVPQFKKCCCCIPLRYGLLAWGYLKVVVALFSLIMVIMVSTLMSYRLEVIAIWALLILICLLDLAFNVVFVVGAHLKNHKLLRIYYIASIVGLIIYGLLSLATLGIQLYVFSRHVERGEPTERHTIKILEQVAVVLVNIGLQCYLLLLTRSEILKLQNSCRFRFVNNAADSECQVQVNSLQEKAKENICF